MFIFAKNTAINGTVIVWFRIFELKIKNEIIETNMTLKYNHSC